jgi:hypothetical protein
MDVCAYNAFVLYHLKNPDLYLKYLKRNRRDSLEELVLELLKPRIDKRIEKIALNNFAGIQSNILESFKAT